MLIGITKVFYWVGRSQLSDYRVIIVLSGVKKAASWDAADDVYFETNS